MTRQFGHRDRTPLKQVVVVGVDGGPLGLNLVDLIVQRRDLTMEIASLVFVVSES